VVRTTCEPFFPHDRILLRLSEIAAFDAAMAWYWQRADYVIRRRFNFYDFVAEEGQLALTWGRDPTMEETFDSMCQRLGCL
jgi:hypothetical protein